MVGQIIAISMTQGSPNHVQHIASLKWIANGNIATWSSRSDMVARVRSSSPGTFFTNVNGYTADVYVASNMHNAWVQTEPDATKVDNLLMLPRQ